MRDDGFLTRLCTSNELREMFLRFQAVNLHAQRQCPNLARFQLNLGNFLWRKSNDPSGGRMPGCQFDILYTNLAV